MITKIQVNGYLGRMDNMSAADRAAFLGRVGEWLDGQCSLLQSKGGEDLARFQNVLQCSAAWNDAECRAWQEGVSLLSALVAVADTGLPDALYAISAKRAIRKLVSALSSVFKGQEYVEAMDVEPAVAVAAVAPEKPAAPMFAKPGASAPVKLNTGAAAEPVRPKHIDQYVHLLPRKTQERAAMVKELLHQMEIGRENARLLMNDGNAKGDDIAKWANLATKCDTEVKSIYRELDAEWAKLVKSGRVVVDDLGNARVVTAAEKPEARKEEKAEPENGEKPEPDNAEKRGLSRAEKRERRLEYLKKWLRDTRTKPSEERAKMWRKNCKELVKLGGEITDTIKKAGEYYGVTL